MRYPTWNLLFEAHPTIAKRLYPTSHSISPQLCAKMWDVKPTQIHPTKMMIHPTLSIPPDYMRQLHLSQFLFLEPKSSGHRRFYANSLLLHRKISHTDCMRD